MENKLHFNKNRRFTIFDQHFLDAGQGLYEVVEVHERQNVIRHDVRPLEALSDVPVKSFDWR